MYAVFRTGGKQYRASTGDRLKVEKLDAAAGEDIAFEEVLMVGEGDGVTIGAPLVAGGRVEARVVEQGRDRKIDVVKFRRRKNYQRLKGHRQHYTLVEITGISGGAA